MAQDDINGSYLKQRNNAYLTPSQRMKQQFQAEAIVEDTDRPFSIMPVIDFAGDVIGDVAGGIVEIPKQTAGGVLDATKELAQFLESAIPLGTLGGDDLTEDSFIELGEARTVTGGLVRGVSQFLTGFLPAMKGAKAAGLATKGAKGVGTAMGAGAVADAIVFDPHEDRLSNLVEQFPELQNPVTGYLAADPDDSEAEGRFKNAIEGLALGALGEGFFSAAKGIKAARVNRIEKDKLASEMAQIDSLASIDVPEGNGVNVGEVKVEQAEGKIIFHGTDAEFDEFDVTKSADGTVWFTDSKEAIEGGEVAASGKGRIVERVIDEENLKLGDWDDIDKYSVDELIEQGYDGVRLEGEGETTYQIFNPEKLSKKIGLEPQANIDIPAPLFGEDNRLTNINKDGGMWQAIKSENPDVKDSGKVTVYRATIGDEIAPNDYVALNKDIAEGHLDNLADRGETGKIITQEIDVDELMMANDATEFVYTPRAKAVEADAPKPKAEPEPPKDIPVKADVVDDFIPFQDKLGGADEPTFKVGSKKAGAERAANINLRNINTTKDVEDAIEGTAAKYSKDINEARREIITQEETIKLADDLGLTVDELLSRRKGQAFNAEQAVAARNLLIASGEKLVALAKVAKTGGDVDVAAFRRALAQHNAIQSQVSGLTAEAGRALQSFNIIAKSSKQQERMIRESLDIGGGIDVSREMAEKISMLDSPMKVNIATRDLQKATKGEMFYELWINGLLSSPATHSVNMLSNALVAGWSVGERKIASMIGGVLDVQSIPSGEASAQAYGMIYGAKDGFRLAWEALKTGEPSDLLNKIETHQYRAISAENLELSGTAGRAADFLGNVARLSGRFLTSEDEFFKSVGYRMELHAQAYRSAHEQGLEGDALARRMIEIINDPPENIELDAINAMRYQTFTRELGDTGKTLQNGIGAINRFTIDNVGVPSARVILPFIQTPTNIVKYVAERTPLAALSKDFRADIKAGGARRDMALAKVATGSMAMAIGVEMSLSGQITGGGPLNYEMKNMMRATGWQPYSIRVGDKYISYGRLDPIGAFLGLAADAAEVVGQADDADAFDVAYAASIAVGKNLTSKTYLSGLAEFFDVMSSTSADPESDETKARRFIERMGSSIVPAGVAQVERVIDPTMSATQGIIEKVKSRIPSLSSDLPPRRNIFGEPIVLEGGIGPDIMSPFYASTDKKDSIADEIVSQRTVVSMPNRSIRGVKLDTRQYDKYVRLYAGESNPYIKKPLRVALKDLFNSSQYREGTDGQEGSKSAMIRGVFNGYKQAAQQAIIEQDTSLVISIQQEIQEKKINLGVQ